MYILPTSLSSLLVPKRCFYLSILLSMRLGYSYSNQLNVNFILYTS
nr:MAG TPA: D-Ala-teichoic acid biosynthesis protein [Caudoviricetes sp.]